MDNVTGITLDVTDRTPHPNHDSCMHNLLIDLQTVLSSGLIIFPCQMKYKVCLSELKQRFSDLYFLFS